MVLYYVFVFIAFFVGATSQIATICDDEPLNTFLPDVRDCNAWFFCSSNGPIRGNCFDQYLFNPRTRLCDWPRNVDCFQCPSNLGMHKMSMDGSCRKFIRCISGIASQNVCADGLQYNKISGQCDLKSVVQCESGFRCPDKLPNNGSVIAFRDNRNCSVYFLCIGDTEPIRQECNPELHFDPITNLCTYMNYTDCPINQITGGFGDGPGVGLEAEAVPYDPTVTTAPIEEPIQGSTSSYRNLSTETSDLSFDASHDPSTELPLEPGTDEPAKPFECPFDGIHVHQYECTEYYICTNNIAHHMRCAEGLHFNVANLQCDFPENANYDFYNIV